MAKTYEGKKPRIRRCDAACVGDDIAHCWHYGPDKAEKLKKDERECCRCGKKERDGWGGPRDAA